MFNRIRIQPDIRSVPTVHTIINFVGLQPTKTKSKDARRVRLADGLENETNILRVSPVNYKLWYKRLMVQDYVVRHILQINHSQCKAFVDLLWLIRHFRPKFKILLKVKTIFTSSRSSPMVCDTINNLWRCNCKFEQIWNKTATYPIQSMKCTDAGLNSIKW